MLARRPTLDPSLALAGFVVLVLAAATMGGPLPLLAFAGLVVCDVTLLRWSAGRSADGSVSLERLVPPFLSGAWIALLTVGLHNFSHRAASATVTSGSLATAIELLFFAAVGGGALAILRVWGNGASIPGALLAFTAWMLAAVTWSDTAFYALARGFQYVVLVILALATAVVRSRSTEMIEQVVGHALRGLVVMVLGLIALGFLVGPLFVVMSANNVGRFAWPGAHPVNAGVLLGAGFVILLSAPTSVLRFSPPVRIGMLAVYAFAIYENQTRTALAGVAFAVVLVVLRWAMAGSGGAIGAVYVAGAVAVTVLTLGGAIGGYLLRGDDVTELWSLNGRDELWGVGFDALQTPADWLLGLGPGTTRTLFIEEFAWANTAHNSLLGILVNYGVIGVAIMLAALGSLVVGLRRSRMRTYEPALSALLMFVIAYAVSSDTIVEPSFGTVLLFFIAGAVHPRCEVGPGSPASTATPAAAAARRGPPA